MKEALSSKTKYTFGYYISLFGTVLILLWVGAFKFTPTEAQSIVPLIEHHPLSFWMYSFFSVQTVSNIVGVVEITIAIALLFTFKYSFLKKYVGIALCVVFLTTISYLFTTPGIWRLIDGFPITDFFILKDIMYLGFGVSLLESTKK